MKQLGALLVLTFVAGCAGGSMPSVTPVAPDSNTSSMSIVNARVPTGERPSVTKITVRSILLNGTINGKKVNAYVNGTCKVANKNGIAVGCGLTAKTTLRLKKVAAGLFTQPAAKGCLVAVAPRITVKVAAGKVIPFVFKWTGKCK